MTKRSISKYTLQISLMGNSEWFIANLVDKGSVAQTINYYNIYIDIKRISD